MEFQIVDKQLVVHHEEAVTRQHACSGKRHGSRASGLSSTPSPFGLGLWAIHDVRRSPRCSTGVVNVPADGLNVRVAPNGPAVMSLVNGTPLIPFDKQGDWLLVAPACDLTPTWAWSWNAGVPLNRCWVYF